MRLAIVRLVGLAFLAFGLWLMHHDWRDKGLHLVMAIVGAYFIVRPSLASWLSMRKLRAAPHFNSTIHWTFTEDQLAGVTDSSRFSTHWSHVFEAISTAEGHLIYPQKGIYFWIPKAGFDTETGDAELRRLLQTKTKHQELK